MNNKEILIETLRGSTERLNDLPNAINGVDIYDETGHVDTNFFTAALLQVVKMQEAVNVVVSRLEYLLCPSLHDEKKKEGKDGGKNLKPEEILQRCTFKDNVLHLPQVQLDKKSYATVKQWVEEAGGKWNGGKVQGFTFDFDATRVASILLKGERCNLAQEFQFFETPADIADWLVSLVGELDAGMRILEPSAGRGAIIKAIHRVCPEVTVDCCELMPENREFLQTMQNVNIIGEDFVKEKLPYLYDVILANPPFSKNQDIRHLRLMYDRLKPCGVVAAITSTHWVMGQEKACVEFKKWLKEVDAHTYEIGEGKFASSGTKVNTMAIVITKRTTNN